ncbi:DoxX family protein [Hymenobacter elongatus]|uniref:DoxX family protein n=1 Tax=Hymenobacter elongatus TaxID=877208 RepID=A0A4Z0PIW6_9BACT|nr:DoxX family protein [Hymenobacter elongatus]TGE15400.1 DoxX family protein [Hymenobacter elongatus]
MKKVLFGSYALPSRPADVALLLFRLHVGLSIAIGAGWGKLSSLAGAGGPPEWFVQQVSGLGFTQPSPYVWAWLACWGEFAGGLLIAVGLLTRLSALQLAFQFFVISFLWYEKPEFLTGMYYQQLLFWAFALLSVVGSGRYSLDYWLARKGHHQASEPQPAGVTKPALAMLALGLTLTASPAKAQTPQEPATVTMRELADVAQQWQGSLTYRNYSDQKLVTLPTVLNGMQSSPQELVLDFIYQEPEGGQVKGYDKVQFSADGTRVVWDGVAMQVRSKTQLPDQTLQFVLEGQGRDDDKSCLLRRTVLCNPHLFSVVKEVKYDGSSAFIIRNTYRFQQ